MKALLAAEDHRFFEHEGVDLWRILGAIRANLLARRPVQGGSTLTQQLVKNFFLSQEKVFSRKVVEIGMATIVEMHYSKLEILENYLNEIYLGQNGAKGIFGMWEAARVYFGKEPRDLTLGEVAVLAGMVKAPNTYSPLRHPDRIIPRRNYVLQRMRELGHVSAEEYDAALKEKIVPRTLPPDDNNAPYFADFIRKALAEQFPDSTLTTSGLRVLTSLDLRLQEHAYTAVQKGLKELESKVSTFATVDTGRTTPSLSYCHATADRCDPGNDWWSRLPDLTVQSCDSSPSSTGVCVQTCRFFDRAE